MILIVAATERELEGARGLPAVECVCCGVGPVDAAVVTAQALTTRRPDVVLNVGIAGTRRTSPIRPLALVIGDGAHYCDMSADWVPRTIAAAPTLVAAARRALPDAVVTTIGTSARVGGTSGCEVEAMEGYGVLRAASLIGVPAMELRAVSNEIEERDRARWQFEAAFVLLADGVRRAIDGFTQLDVGNRGL